MSVLGRKVYGFLGHGACLGCFCCLKRFTGATGNMDYTGFDRENWTNRRREIHMEKALHTLAAKRMFKVRVFELQCVLLELPYFDSVQKLLIDPMHNLLLGTSNITSEELSCLNLTM